MVIRSLTVEAVQAGPSVVRVTLCEPSGTRRAFEFEIDHEMDALADPSGDFGRFIGAGGFDDAVKPILSAVGRVRRGESVSLPLVILCSDVL
jgi:hypothetical protein